MKSLKYILALGAFFVVSISVAACGGAVPGNAVAVVAGNPITTSAFNHWMYVAAKGQAASSPGSPVIVPTDPPDFKQCLTQVRKQLPALAKIPSKTITSDCQKLFTSLSSQVMDFLVKAYWYQAEAAAQHIKVSDAQVQQAFAAARKQQFPTDTALQGFLTQSGQTLQDILFRVRVNQLYMKLIAKQSTSVTSAQIQSFYSSHLSQFGTPQTRDIRIVLAKTSADAQAAKTALSQGKSWDAVARQYSTDSSTKNKGGLLAGVAKGQQDQALDQAAFSAPTNKLLGPVHGQFGYYVFEVTKITKATQQTLAQATPQIRAQLSSQLQSAAQTAVTDHAKKNWLRKTECRKAYSMVDCNGYKAPKASAASPSTTTPSTTSTR